VQPVGPSGVARFLRGKRLASMPAPRPLRRSAAPLFFLFFFAIANPGPP